MALHRYLGASLLTTAILCTCPSAVLSNYLYDALGRRITFNDLVAGVTNRYYYDGQAVIEERNGACPGPSCDSRLRYHVNGSQYIDERVATFTDSSGAFTYYLTGGNFSVTGMGNADGSAVERIDYSSTGDFAGGVGEFVVYRTTMAGEARASRGLFNRPYCR